MLTNDLTVKLVATKQMITTVKYTLSSSDVKLKFVDFKGRLLTLG